MALRQISNGTSSAGNPFGGATQSTALVQQSAPPTGIQVTLPNGSMITVGSAAEVQLLDAAFKQQRANRVDLSVGYDDESSGLGGLGGGGGGTGGFLRTGADALQAVGGFLQGRNLARKRDDIEDALDGARTLDQELAQLGQSNPALAGLVNVLSRRFEVERRISNTAVEALDDSITAVDLAAGGSVAKVAAEFLSGPRSSGNLGTAVAVGGAGLGLGLLLSDRTRDRRRR